MLLKKLFMSTTNILNYLKQLQVNNNREWFNENKSLFLEVKESFEQLTEGFIAQISAFDPRIKDLKAKDCVFRIYRDVRFGKDKSPYKTHFGAYINQGGRKGKTCGYYIHIEPDATMIAGGIYGPPADVLFEIRDAIYADTDEFKEIIHSEEFVAHFGEIEGDKLKRAPKGFPKDFEDIELLKHKSFICTKMLTNDELCSPTFVAETMTLFKAMKPFNDFFNRAILAME